MSDAVDLRLLGATAPDGELVTVECAGGRITAVEPGAVTRADDATVVDLRGMVLMPALVEPHAHIDKAYTADVEANPTGDLDGAIAVSLRWFETASAATIERQARRALGAYVDKGCLAVRTHVALGRATGLRSMEGVLAAAAAFSELIDVQVVAHIGPPITGLAGAENLALLRAAIDMGATHVGGTPYRSEDPVAETAACLEVAAAASLGVDLHTDETLDVGSLSVRDLAAFVRANDFPAGVAASHCVSLGVQPLDVQRAVADELAAAGVAVVCLPQTNLFLQSRGIETSKPRGLTALAALAERGATVCAGGDNVQDPFNPMGRGDPLEAASLLVTAGHLDAADAFHAVTDAARDVLGLSRIAIAPGSPADLVAVPGANLREAIAEGDARRVVVRRGAVVDVAPWWTGEDPVRPTTGHRSAIDKEVAGV